MQTPSDVCSDTLTHSKRTISRNAAFGLTAQCWYLATRFIQTPWTLEYVGIEAYGFWSVLFVLLAYIGIHRMGVTTAFVTGVAHSGARQDWGRASRLLSSGFSLLVLLAVPVCGTVFLFSDRIVSLLGTSPEIHTDARNALLLTSFSTWIALTLGCYQNILEGLQKIHWVRTVDVAATTLETALVALLLRTHWGLTGLAIAYSVRMLAPIPMFMFLAKCAAPDIKVCPVAVRYEDVRPLLVFGGPMQALGCVFLVTSSLDRLALTTFSGLASAGLYELARKLISLTAALPTQFFGPMIPAAADLAARTNDKPGAMGELVFSATRWTAVLAALPLLPLALAGQPFMVAWLGRPAENTSAIMLLLSSGAYLHLLTGPATSVLRGMGRVRHEMTYALVWLVCAALLLPTAAREFGLIGVAAASSCVQGLCSIFLMVLARDIVQIRFSQWLRLAAQPMLSALAPAILVRLVWDALQLPLDRFHALSFLAVTGPLYIAAVTMIIWKSSLSEAEREVAIQCGYRMVRFASFNTVCRERSSYV